MARTLRWLVALPLLVAAWPAQAYVLPADQIIRLMLEQRRPLQIRDVTLQLTAERAGQSQPVDERLYLKRPERARLQQQDDPPTLRIDNEGRAAAGSEGQLRPVPGTYGNLLPLLWLPRGPTLEDLVQRVLAGLKAAGVDTEVASLGRQDEGLAYIIGARSWEPERAQVWLDKATFMPIRLQTLVPGENGKLVREELRLSGYNQGPTSPMWPQTFESLRDGVRQRLAEVNSVQINHNLPETLFEWGGRRR